MLKGNESVLDDALRFVSQAKAIVLLLSNEESFEDIEPWVVANTLWMLCDRLTDLEDVITRMEA